MATFMANASNIERKWYVIDAANKPMGRTATVAATLLRGKHKATYTPHADCGDFVIVINADKAILTGNKLEKKYYRHHSGYIGGLKEITLKRLLETKPEAVITHAVKGMLPKNTLGRNMIKKLHVYAGPEHNHAAQKPEVLEINA